jgi:hypothetical protein
VSKATLIQADAEAFSVASDGTLLTRVRQAITSSLGWADPSGHITPAAGTPVALQGYGLALSPDGHQAALIVAARGTVNLVLRDLQTGAETPLTSNRSTDVKGTWMLRYPIWYPAGDRLLYVTGGVETAARVFERRLDAAGAPHGLVGGICGVISHDGRTLYVIDDVRGEGRLSRRAVGGDGSIGPAEPMLPGVDIDDVAPSPDGNAAAIVFHGERDRLEIDVIDLHGSARQRLTASGGTHPRFSADGRTLYYLVSEPAANGRRVRRIMRVSIASTAPLQIRKPEAVFAEGSGAEHLDIAQYDVTRDGRLLVAIEDAASRRSRAVLVQNWPALVSGH